MPVKKALIQLPCREYASLARKELNSQVVGEHRDGGEMFESDNAVAISAEEVYSACIKNCKSVHRKLQRVTLTNDHEYDGHKVCEDVGQTDDIHP